MPSHCCLVRDLRACSSRRRPFTSSADVTNGNSQRLHKQQTLLTSSPFSFRQGEALRAELASEQLHQAGASPETKRTRLSPRSTFLACVAVPSRASRWLLAFSSSATSC